jgi:NAD(P)-dependent dehydrogenase (short-subunit alcohol dehydrogenase family)
MSISSVGGLRGYPSNGIYCATKFAIEGITSALAAEIAPFGLECVIVEPGYFRTAFLANPASGANLAPANPAYKGTTAHEARKNFELYNGRQPGNPVEGAARMWEYGARKGMFEGKKRLLRLPLGSDTCKALKALIESLEETATLYDDVMRSTDFKD